MMKKRFSRQHSGLSLRFSPTAWAKLVFLRDLTLHEVGGFGITDKEDLLFVKDIVLVKQNVSVASVCFDDHAVADLFEDQVQLGRKPEQFARIWIHCHPGNSPKPSCTDEETFKRAFGPCDWSIMAIVAQDNSSYARLHFKAGPGGNIEIPVYVEYECDFKATDHDNWEAEYKANVTTDCRFSENPKFNGKSEGQAEIETFGYDESQLVSAVPYEDILMELDSMHPSERQAFLEELSSRSEFWDEYENEMEVFYE